MALSKQIVHLRDFAAEAARLRKHYGQTNLYSTGAGPLDNYLGGGYGRQHGYEIVVLYGAPGIGKSTVALNFLKHPVESDRKVGMLVLEDDGADVFNRFVNILGNENAQKYIMHSDNIHFLPPDELVKSWKLDDLLQLMDEWFNDRGLDLILLDHLQFAFDNAEAIRGENEYVAQRLFMQKLNQMMKRNKKTVILVSHVNGNSQAKGMNKIFGSSAIQQVGTKVIEVSEDDVAGQIRIEMHKTRFTKKPGIHYCMKLNNGRLEKC